MSPTSLMIRDELIGFSRSRVMLVLWLLLPAIAFTAYFLISNSTELSAAMGADPDAPRMSATSFVGFLLSSIAGTLASLIVAVDLVSERQRKVYELFVIRPLRRDSILVAKFVAASLCVSGACVISLGLGLAIDELQGDQTNYYDALKGVTSTVGVVALSAAVGVFFGVTSSSILVAVILVWFAGSWLLYVPMVPTLLGLWPDAHWAFMAITVVLIVLVMAGSIALFRKSEF